MKIYLLNAPFIKGFVRCGRWPGGVSRGGTVYYPIWLSYATGVLEKEFGKGSTRLVDAPAWDWDLEKVIADAKQFKPDLIVVDTNFSSITNDTNVAAKLKENVEGTKTIIVGPPTSQYSDRMLQNPNVDATARMEYDFTVRDYAKSIDENKTPESILGLSYRNDGKIIHNPLRPFIESSELDDIPFVSQIYKEHLRIEDYFLGHTINPMVQIFTGRGCPNQCIFCQWPETLMGRKYRVRSVENVVDEFEYIKNELPGVREIFVEDDTFTIDRKRLKAICDEIRRRRLNITWSCNARANLDYESMKIMKSAGCRLLDVGYESGSNVILKNIKKGITTEDSSQFTADAKKARLMILADVIIGMPGETKDTAQETIRMIKRIKPNIVQFSVATPIPGTQFYEWARQNKYLQVDDIEEAMDKNGYQKCIISYPEFTSSDIERYVDRGLKEYYLNVSFIPVALSNVMRKTGIQEFMVMLKSAEPFIKYFIRKR